MAKTINLKAADLASGQTAQFRDLTFTPAGGSPTTIKVLSTAAATIPPAGTASNLTGYTKTRIPVALRVNPSTGDLEVKTGNVLVEDGSTDSAWAILVDYDDYDV